MDVVAHSDLVAVIHHWRTGHRQQQAFHEFDTTPITFQQRRQAPPYAQVDARLAICGVDLPQIVTLAARNHLKRELIMVAQEDRPLAVLGNFGGLLHDVGNGKAVGPGDRHIHARHERKVKAHMAFVAVAEVFLRIFRPLIRFGQEQSIGVFTIENRANLAQHRVRFGQIFVIRSLPFH